MPKRPELIGIGEFARRVRLSVKQLRRYDELGLLPPAYVDPDSGYRYYHRGQARTAVTVALLRSLDVPLADIHRALVADADGVAAILANQRSRIQAEVDRRHRALRSLDRLIAGTELLPYDVTERDEPGYLLAGVRRRCLADELEREAPAAVGELAERLPGAVFDAGPVIGVYPLDLDGEIDFFVGVGAAADGLDTLALAPARVAVATHAGPYAELQLAYYPLLAHVEERGLFPAEHVREIYLEGPPAVDPERARTEVALPFVPKPAGGNR